MKSGIFLEYFFNFDWIGKNCDAAFDFEVDTRM